MQDDRAGFAKRHLAIAGGLGLAIAFRVGAELEVDLVRWLVATAGVELEVRAAGIGLVAAFGVEVSDVRGFRFEAADVQRDRGAAVSAFQGRITHDPLVTGGSARDQLELTADGLGLVFLAASTGSQANRRDQRDQRRNNLAVCFISSPIDCVRSRQHRPGLYRRRREVREPGSG